MSSQGGVEFQRTLIVKIRTACFKEKGDGILVDQVVSDIKRLFYRGVRPPSTIAEIAYIVSGQKIMFTALENVMAKTSTITAAEEIVLKIYLQEKIPWRNYEFYDLRTKVGYPHHQDDNYFCVEQLMLKHTALMVHEFVVMETVYEPLTSGEIPEMRDKLMEYLKFIYS